MDLTPKKTKEACPNQGFMATCMYIMHGRTARHDRRAHAGAFVLFTFGVFHLQLIQALNVSPDVVPTAARYLSIRAWAAPAATASAVLAVRASQCDAFCS
jgi:hypothetical protein